MNIVYLFSWWWCYLASALKNNATANNEAFMCTVMFQQWRYTCINMHLCVMVQVAKQQNPIFVHFNMFCSGSNGRLFLLFCGNCSNSNQWARFFLFPLFFATFTFFGFVLCSCRRFTRSGKYEFCCKGKDWSRV